jgi:hypothetical protein
MITELLKSKDPMARVWAEVFIDFDRQMGGKLLGEWPRKGPRTKKQSKKVT